MRKHYKKILAAGLCSALILSGCKTGSQKAAANTSADSQSKTALVQTMSVQEADGYYFTARDKEVGYDEDSAVQITLNGSLAQSDSSLVKVQEGTVTISGEGVYVLSGSLTDGMIVVDAPDDAKVQLVFDNVSISNADGAALYVKEADKVFLTLDEGTKNSLENKGSYVQTDDNNVDGVIFSKSDLTVNGSGELKITAQEGSGIVSKDELVVTGGTIGITAAKHGLEGKDSVAIGGGTIDISAVEDGVHAKGSAQDETETQEASETGSQEASETETQEASETGSDQTSESASSVLNEDGTAVKKSGFVYMNGGTLTIQAQDDGIHAEGAVIQDGGTIDIQNSNEGVEGFVVIKNEGDLSVVASDDGINATSGQTTDMAAGEQVDMRRQSPDGTSAATQTEGSSGQQTTDSAGAAAQTQEGGGQQSADGTSSATQTGEGGGQQMKEPPAGGERPQMRGKTDGQMPQMQGAAPGEDRQTAGGGPGGMDAAQEGVYIQITGGKTVVKAGGDGLDSNGSLYISGGETYVEGPEDNGNGALDYNGEAVITGGTLLAAGSAGMVQNMQDSSNQSSLMVNTGKQSAGTTITLTDENGQTVVSYTMSKQYENVVISADGMKKGSSYTVQAGTYEETVTL